MLYVLVVMLVVVLNYIDGDVGVGGTKKLMRHIVENGDYGHYYTWTEPGTNMTGCTIFFNRNIIEFKMLTK